MFPLEFQTRSWGRLVEINRYPILVTITFLASPSFNWDFNGRTALAVNPATIGVVMSSDPVIGGFAPIKWKRLKFTQDARIQSLEVRL